MNTNQIQSKTSLADNFLIVLMWIGLWGIFDTIINKYIPAENYSIRILIYLLIFGAAFISYKYFLS